MGERTYASQPEHPATGHTAAAAIARLITPPTEGDKSEPSPCPRSRGDRG